MDRQCLFTRLIVLVMSGLFVACQVQGRTKQKASDLQEGALSILRRYVELRLQDADWKEYSKFITWPDEPSWDCKWVVSKFDVGTPAGNAEGMAIPVVYSRVGLFCYEFDFEANPKVATIRYELVKRQGHWKVSGPIPDYPEISGDVLLRWLNSIAEKSDVTQQRRTRALATAQEIRNAILATRKISPN
jgi:hypothetical protein